MIMDVREGKGPSAQMIVMKFGGSSLESAAAIQNVISLVKARRDSAPVVVVSAMGKTTDRLLRIGMLAAEGRTSGRKLGTAISELHDLELFHISQLRLLMVDPAPAEREISEMFADAMKLVVGVAQMGSFTPADSDALVSYGERLSSLVVAGALKNAGLPAIHLRAENLILTDGHHTQAGPKYWETYARLRRAIPTDRSGYISVMGGFIGSTEKGVPTTLGRGGSDFTAAIVGAAINADEVQIWTDVNGMLSCDPRVLPGGRCLRQICYAEATEMAEWGAKVLHPATVAPAIRQRVPVIIRNSRNSNHPGTRVEHAPLGRDECRVKSIACQREITLLRIRPHRGASDAQLCSLVKSLVAETHTECKVITSKGCLEVVLPNSAPVEQITTALAAVGCMELERGLAAVSLIGRGLETNRGLLSHAVRILGGKSIPFYAVATVPMRITFIVAEQEMAAATEALHDEFVKFQESGSYYREFTSRSTSHNNVKRSYFSDTTAPEAAFAN
jgi:aspartate kinase